MNRLPGAAFASLVLATVGAFFVTQHLKVTTPLIAGSPRPYPASINPRSGSTCGGVDHRGTTISFYLLHRSDDVDVEIIDQGGAIVRTLASARHMRKGVRIPDGVFYWNGREDDGRVAPDGTYYVRVALIQQGRTVVISNASGPEPITVKTVAPRPVITSVEPSVIPRDGSSAVTIRYRGNENRGGTVLIYRLDLPGGPRLVKSFRTPWKGQSAIWDGTIDRRPAPAGTYLVGLEVSDSACNTGRFPPSIPPHPGSGPRTAVTVRYLGTRPPLNPVRVGSRREHENRAGERWART